MVPKGRLIMLSNTDRNTEHKKEKEDQQFFLCDILETLKVDHRTPLEFLVTKDDQHQIIKIYSEKLLKAGYHNFNFLHLNGEHKNTEMISFRLARARTVILMDHPSDICRIMQNSPALRILYKKYFLEEDFIIIGINAGAICIPGAFMHESGVVNGLGFINKCIIDTEFDYKTRFRKLIKTILFNKECFGLGLGENTALIVEEGIKATCRGRGPVMLIDARNVTNLNTKEFTRKKTLFVKNLKGHILTDGSILNLNSGEVIARQF